MNKNYCSGQKLKRHEVGTKLSAMAETGKNKRTWFEEGYARDMRRTPLHGRRALCAAVVIGVLLVLGGCGGSGGDSLPSRTASAELPTVSRSIDRTEPASTTVEAPPTEPTPDRTPILGRRLR